MRDVFQERIIFATLRMTPPFFMGGAEISQRILAERLIARGFQVTCIGSYAHPVRNTLERLPDFCEHLTKSNIPYTFEGEGSELSYTYNGISCLMLPQNQVINKLSEKLEYNVRTVFSWLEGSEEIIQICNGKGINSVTWIHDVLSIGLSSLRSKPRFILFASEFIKERVKELFGMDGFVFYPPINFEKDQNVRINEKTSVKTITLVNPIPEKGLKTFLELSLCFPDITFLAVEGWRPVAIDEYYLKRNVKYLPKQFDMNPIFRQTHILLAPSHYEEGFGRVVAEAALFGVPSIVSNRGGLIEAVGNGGMVLGTFNTEDWISALKHIDDSANYERFSAQAKQYAKRFLADPIDKYICTGVF